MESTGAQISAFWNNHKIKVTFSARLYLEKKELATKGKTYPSKRTKKG
jgi:hypothetical protein